MDQKLLPPPGARVSLGAFPTAIEPLDALSPRQRVRLFCKREDAAAAPYGGNKVRKLERILGALPADAPLLTVGAVGSHHVVATALYAGRRGHPVWAVLGPQPATDHARDHARLAAGLLAGFDAIPAWSHLPVALARSSAEVLRVHGRLPVVLPPGGSSPEGVLGSVELGLELAADVAAGRLPRPDHVYVPVGTGGTAAGLWVGLRAAGLPTEVVGVRVTDRTLANIPRLRSLARQAVGRLGRRLALPLSVNPLRLVHDWFGAGYGHAVPAGVEAARLARDRAGLQLEPTYTAKALAACLDEIRREVVGGVVVFVDTVNSRPLQPLLHDAPAALPPAIDALLQPPG